MELELNIIYNEDCMKGMAKRIPDESIDFILTDPPYGTIKGMKLKGDYQTDWDNKVDMEELFKEYYRVLKENGKLIIFSQNKFTQEVRNLSTSSLSYAYPLIWEKDHFANFLGVNKAPVQIFEDMSVFSKRYGLLPKSRAYARKVLEYIGKESLEIRKEMGHERANHFLRVDTLQFGSITKETYNELNELYAIDSMEGYLEHDEWLDLYSGERSANKASIAFNLPEGANHVTNLFKVPKDKNGVHPTQKPVPLLEQLIELYTEPGAVVLDSFMGSGSTAVAAYNTGRHYVGFELDEGYYNMSEERMSRIREM